MTALIRILLLLLSTPAVAASEETDKLSVDLTGVGSRTCAYWLSSQDHKSEGTVWIYGFWSGLNYVAAASGQSQAKASSAVMIAAVERECRREPSGVLAAAAWSAYVDFNKQ
ncbi:MAG: hypothetical protein ACXWKP_21070 [Bradyrhizobium sp.]